MYVETDEEIIRKHDPRVRHRARIELAMVKQLIASAEKAGYTLAVDEYEEEGDTTGVDYDVRSAIFNLDEAHVEVTDQAGNWVGWILLVLGNDGYDIISDYTVGLEEFLADCNALADKLEEGMEAV